MLPVVDNVFTPIEMADKVLKWFCMDIRNVLNETLEDERNRANRRYLRWVDIGVPIVDWDNRLNSSDFLFYLPLILDKLVKDMFITKFKDIDINGHEIEVYSQNIEGILFSAKGGYSGEITRNAIQIRNANRKDWLIIIGTWLAGGGSILLCVVELIKHYSWEACY